MFIGGEAMTNEEMAEKIKQSGDKKLTEMLWENTKKILFIKSFKKYFYLKERFSAMGIELEDLYQECYFVFLEAIKAYCPPYKFVTFLEIPFKSMTKRLLKNSDSAYTDNIDEVKNGDGYSISETLSDDKNDIYLIIDDRTDSEIVRGAVEKLEQKQRRVIKLYYFNDMNDRKIAEFLHVRPASVGQLRQRALLQLKRMPDIQSLYYQSYKINGKGGFLSPDKFYLKNFQNVSA